MRQKTNKIIICSKIPYANSIQNSLESIFFCWIISLITTWNKIVHLPVYTPTPGFGSAHTEHAVCGAPHPKARNPIIQECMRSFFFTILTVQGLTWTLRRCRSSFSSVLFSSSLCFGSSDSRQIGLFWSWLRRHWTCREEAEKQMLETKRFFKMYKKHNKKEDEYFVLMPLL